MKTRLIYKDFSRQKVQAAFLRGSDLREWLLTIQPWGIPLVQLEAYLVPESLKSRNPAGLLVIFANYSGPVPENLLQPCYLLGKSWFCQWGLCFRMLLPPNSIETCFLSDSFTILVSEWWDLKLPIVLTG
ncbi:MAG: hypothetical protein IPP17_01245 [Bacteroidetes bacterium]|nr:hypothetical protein [Bacteroidota bacterium]